MALVKVPKSDPAGWLFPLFGVPFVLLGLYIIVERFFLDAKIRKSTGYAVTNRRAIILTTLFAARSPSAARRIMDGGRSGTCGFHAPRHSRPFEMIGDVRGAYAIIQNAKRNDIRPPQAAAWPRTVGRRKFWSRTLLTRSGASARCSTIAQLCAMLANRANHRGLP